MKSYTKVLPRPTGIQELTTPFQGWLGSLYDYLDSGTYTPTLVNTLNVAASTAHKCQYLRVGNVVTVSGSVAIDPTAAAPTTTQITISLPIPTRLVDGTDCSGVASCNLVDGQTSGVITGNLGVDVAGLSFRASDLANRIWYFTFTYEVL